MLKYLLLALAIFSAPSPSSRVWTDWQPAAPHAVFAIAQDGCGPYECRLTLYGQTTCWEEGSSFATPCCDFLCVCSPDGLDCGWEM